VVNDLIKVGMIKRRSDVHNVHVERVADSYPIYHKNYTGHLEKARAGLSQFENLELAGRTGLFWYNNMDHSIENGLQLAEKLLAEGGKKQSKDKAKRA
jgi:protoporphyrinogen oxidase